MSVPELCLNVRDRIKRQLEEAYPGGGESSVCNFFLGGDQNGPCLESGVIKLLNICSKERCSSHPIFYLLYHCEWISDLLIFLAYVHIHVHTHFQALLSV